ncbi:uncharacterized protein LOC128554300, partial [Mercenaria mercenaria]|uniref:uncharacterized protein LOC128554300 n=1 Tax=Mercenaria mercenaria TaxID=6596 RepID=UPI00234EAC04
MSLPRDVGLLSPENITEEECPADEYSREEIIKINLKQHLIYISHCIKPDDLILHLHCFSEEQKTGVLSEKNLIKASRKALEMLLHDVEEPGRFVELRDALSENDGYPMIVSILDGNYNPEDQNYVKVVELCTPEIIMHLEPSELLPHLLQKGVFKQMDVEEIRAEEKNHGKMRAACLLLLYLPRRTVEWFRCFLQVLISCDLEDIAEMLDPDMFKVLQMPDKNQLQLPKEITDMDGETIETYIKALEKGKTEYNNIRIMVVGHFKAGKTTLVKRLFGQFEDQETTPSTNGIETHVRQCKFISDDENEKITWKLLKDGNKTNWRQVLLQKTQSITADDTSVEKVETTLVKESEKQPDGIDKHVERSDAAVDIDTHVERSDVAVVPQSSEERKHIITKEVKVRGLSGKSEGEQTPKQHKLNQQECVK